MTEANASVQTLWQHLTLQINKMMDEIKVKDAELQAKNAELARIRKELDALKVPKKGMARIVEKAKK